MWLCLERRLLPSRTGVELDRDKGSSYYIDYSYSILRHDLSLTLRFSPSFPASHSSHYHQLYLCSCHASVRWHPSEVKRAMMCTPMHQILPPSPLPSSPDATTGALCLGSMAALFDRCVAPLVAGLAVYPGLSETDRVDSPVGHDTSGFECSEVLSRMHLSRFGWFLVPNLVHSLSEYGLCWWVASAYISIIDNDKRSETRVLQLKGMHVWGKLHTLPLKWYHSSSGWIDVIRKLVRLHGIQEGIDNQ